MKLNLYDFDDTIYKGDSTRDFFFFCYKKGYFGIGHILKVMGKFVQYKTKYINKDELFEYIFSYFDKIKNMEELVDQFWEVNRKKLKSFYLDKKDKSKDIIISASHTFRLKPICDELGVKDLIASEACKKTGKCLEPLCFGEEKVRIFKKKYPKGIIAEMWSDSIVDKPLLDLAEKAFLVKGNKIYDFRKYKPNLFVRFWRWGWGIYHKNEELWNYLIVGGLTTLVSIGSYIFCNEALGFHYQVSNIISWIVAVTFAYYANRWFVFHSRNKKLKEAIGFYGSRIFTLLMEAAILFILVDLITLGANISKVFAQIVVLIANYIISKLFVFKNSTK